MKKYKAGPFARLLLAILGIGLYKGNKNRPKRRKKYFRE